MAFWIAAPATSARQAGYAFATALAIATTRDGDGPVAVKEIEVPTFETLVAPRRASPLPRVPPSLLAAWSNSGGDVASAFSVWSRRVGSTYADEPEKSWERSVGESTTFDCALYCGPSLCRTTSYRATPNAVRSTTIHRDRRRTAARVSMPCVFTALAGVSPSLLGRSSGYLEFGKSGRFPRIRSAQQLAENLLHKAGKVARQAPVRPNVLPQVEEVGRPLIRLTRELGSPLAHEALQ